MTTLDIRTEQSPAVIDGEFVYAHAADAPPRNPHRFATRASALILIADAVAGSTVMGGTEVAVGAWTVSMLLAALIFVFCLFRFNARADAGDR